MQKVRSKSTYEPLFARYQKLKLCDHRKKIRCTGRFPCPPCGKHGLTCEYTASYTRGRLPSVVVDDAVLATISGPAVTPPVSAPEVSTLQSPTVVTTPDFSLNTPDIKNSNMNDHFDQAEKLPASSEDTTQEFPSRSSPEPPQLDRQGHYIGPASGVSFLLRIQKTLHSNSSLSQDSSIFTFGDSPLPEHDPTFFVLPPKVDAQRLVERYFDFAQPAHRFLHRPTIERLLHEFYETQGQMRNREDAPTNTALLFIVFAQAQAYMPPRTSSQDSRYLSPIFSIDKH